MGVVTDAYADVHALAKTITPIFAASPWLAALERATTLDPAAVEQHDALTQLAIRAAHQALSMAGRVNVPPGRITDGENLALLVVSSWGTIDSTVAYLDSMLDAEGRFASPRHFSRSVYSSVASLVAIHFGIHGPCETLSFPHAPVQSAIERARRLLAAERAHDVLIIWADQTASIATDLARRAATMLHKHEFARYASGPLGFGAAALLLAKNAHGFAAAHAESEGPRTLGPGGPFPMDAAVAFIENLLRQ